MSFIDTLPKPEKNDCLFDYAAVLKLLPHRYPFLLIDKVVSFDDSGEKAKIVCVKNVTFNEPFFQGHFPGDPVMPGVLQCEAMAQAGCVYFYYSKNLQGKKLIYYLAKTAAKFHQVVVPGDQLVMEVKVVQLRGKVCKLRGEAFVDGQKAAEAEFMSMLVDLEEAH